MTTLSISPARTEDDFGQPIHHTLGKLSPEAVAVYKAYAA